MIAQQVLAEASYRLAQHYIDKLKQADLASKRGVDFRTHWLGVVDKDWGQIKKWQDWSTTWTADDIEKAEICFSFIMAARTILESRQTTSDRITWLLPALEAAQHLGNTDAECYIRVALGHCYFLLGKIEDAQHHLYHVLDIADDTSDDVNVGHAYLTLGTIRAQRGDLGHAEAAFHKSLAIFERLEQTLNIGRALHKIGVVAQVRGDYQQALDYHSRYLALVEGTAIEEHIAVALNAVSFCLRAMHDYETSKAYTQRVIAICRRVGYTRLLPAALFSLGSCEIELGELEASAAHYAEGVALARSSNIPNECVIGLDNLGYIHSRLGEFEQALAYFDEALVIAKENQFVFLIFEVLLDITNTHIMAGNLEAAKTSIRDLLELAFTINTDRHKAKAVAVAVALWQGLGEHEQTAVWAGLVTQYSQHVDLSLFEPVCTALENELGSQSYQHAIEIGKALTLDEGLSNILTLME